MLRVVLMPSRQLTGALIAAHAAALGLLLPLDADGWVKALLAVAVGASLAHALHRHAWLRSAGAVTAIELDGGDRATVETRGGARHAARVLGTTYVSPQLCVLNLRVAGSARPRHALITGDNVDSESFRQLRVWLRWARHSGR